MGHHRHMRRCRAMQRLAALGAFGPLLLSLSVSAQTDSTLTLKRLSNQPLPYVNCITDSGGTECREEYYCEHPPEWIHQRNGSVMIRTPCQSWTFNCFGETANQPGDSCVYGDFGEEVRITVIENGFIITGGDPVIKYTGGTND